MKKCCTADQALVDQSATDHERQAVALTMCRLLSVEVRVEDEMFDLASCFALDDEMYLFDDVDVEHSGVKELIRHISSSTPDE